MFTNSHRQEERTGKYGTPRVQYLQELVTQFQNASSEEVEVASKLRSSVEFEALKQVQSFWSKQKQSRFFVFTLEVETSQKASRDSLFGEDDVVATLFSLWKSKKVRSKLRIPNGSKTKQLRALIELQCESKEKIVANLANFAYDPYNYTFLRQLNVLELFLDCITEPNEKLVEFGIGGICNSCADPANAAVVIQCNGIPLIIDCLSSPVRNTVNYAIGALYYICNASNKEEILKPEVVDVIRRYAAAGAVSVSFSNLAQSFLDKHVS